jgi:AI-2 transport protein TqsA
MQKPSPPAAQQFHTLVHISVFAVLVGYLLIIGKSLLLPIFVAVISVYILTAASDWLGRQPGVGALPGWARRALVLLGFIVAILALTSVIIATADQLIEAIPSYQKNLQTLATTVLQTFGRDVPADWSIVWQNTLGQIELQSIATSALGSLSALAGVIFLVLIYAMFLMGERAGFAQKISLALPETSGAQLHSIIASINQSIGDYLSIKTLINAILASISYAVMWVFDVDFALFWAILIGLLNYIPFIGSLIGVVFPVLLTIAQFGSIQTTLGVLALLTAAQLWVGNALEPRLIGKKVNLSPFVVLVSLSVWTALWGVAGSILAIPLTAILAIIFGHFSATRPIAVLLSDDPAHAQKAG